MAAAPSAQPARIFLSYARRDAANLAQRLFDHFKGSAWLDKYSIQPGATWTRSIDDALESAGVVLAILTDGSYESNWCTCEHIKALDLGKKIIPLLHQPKARIPTHFAATQYIDFTNPDAEEPWRKLQLAVSALLSAQAVPATAQPAPRQTLVTAPPLPRNYLHRAEAVTALRDQIVTDDPGPSIALTALHGMGGIGKTVLAQALAHDDVVQCAFPDGIVWITVGREPTNDTFVRLQEVRRALGDKPDPTENLTTCQNLYRTVLCDKAALVIVDDVWHTRDIEPFLAEAPRSKILFTTRDESIANDTQAKLHPAGLLTPQQSSELLAQTSALAPDKLPTEAADLIKECARLPLALSMIGAMLRSKPAPFWTHVLHLLRTADISKIKAHLPNYPHSDLFRAIQVSVDQLEPDDRTRYLTLAVLLEDIAIAPYIQRTLWNMDDNGALETRERLISLSLAQREGDDSIRLHDLQMDYLRSQYADKSALDLIHGALRLSAHILEKDPTQFASQLVGRLLLDQGRPTIATFTDEIASYAPRPWIRSLRPTLHPPGTPLLFQLVGHSDPVFSVAVTAEGTIAVSTSRDRTVKVWDLRTGRELQTLRGHEDRVNCVGISLDGSLVLSGSDDQTIRIWNSVQGHEIYRLQGHSARVTAVSITPDGSRAVSGADDGTLIVWDVRKGAAVRTISEGRPPISSLKISLDGTHAIAASGKELTVWDLVSGNENLTLIDASEITGVAVSEDGRTAVSACSEGTLTVWDLTKACRIRNIAGHLGPVTDVAMSSDGLIAVSVSGDQTARVWDLTTGRQLLVLEGHATWITSVAIASKSARAVTGSYDKTLKVWNLNAAADRRTPKTHFSAVTRLVITPDHNYLLSASWDKRLKKIHIATGKEILTLRGHDDCVTDVAITPNGLSAVSASWDGSLRIWDLRTGDEIKKLQGHQDKISSVAVTPDGKHALSASWDNTLLVWDLATGREVLILRGHEDRVTKVVIPDGDRAVSVSWDKSLRVWDLNTGIQLINCTSHSAALSNVTVTEDGTRALSASWDETLRLWDLTSGQELRVLSGHCGRVTCVALTHDHAYAVSGSSDDSVRIWSMNTHDKAGTFYADTAVLSCTVTSDNLILAGDLAGHIHYLRLEQ